MSRVINYLRGLQPFFIRGYNPFTKYQQDISVGLS